MYILLLDNYDSYTHNLRQYLEETGLCTVHIVKNDKISEEHIEACDALIISPGPGLPYGSGRLMDMIAYARDRKPILGVCLGQQAIAESFGGSLLNLHDVFHGISSSITVCDDRNPLFYDLEPHIYVGRYHSWVVNKEDFPSALVISALDDEGNIMALRHRHLPIYAVQFHPESILTPTGRRMLSNFLLSTQALKPATTTAEL